MTVVTATVGEGTEPHRVGFPGVLASAIRPDVNSSSDLPKMLASTNADGL